MAEFMSLVKWYCEKKSEALEGKQLFTKSPVYKNGIFYYIECNYEILQHR